MLKDILAKIGLSEKEITVYTSVLEHGRLSYTDLSKKTGLNRTTTYSVAQELLSNGMLQEDFSSPVKALVAAPPEALAAMATEEETRLEKKKQLVNEAIEEIRSAPSAAGYVAPAITYIPQQRIQQYFKQRNDVWNASLMATDKTWWGYNDIDFIKQYSTEWLSWYWELAPKEILLKLFSNDEKIEHELKNRMPERREIRFWKGEHVFTGSLWIVGEYVITVNVRQSPHYLIEMRDPALAQNLRTVFAEMWKLTS
ncbi:MAG: helix-turn-helix domain-containing protein [Patescibacteria group bacterium]|nr:helix-turn-helix domain-containing protein [Patescibacteria group bacterium]